jgi:hypothetical protein
VIPLLLPLGPQMSVLSCVLAMGLSPVQGALPREVKRMVKLSLYLINQAPRHENSALDKGEL